MTKLEANNMIDQCKVRLNLMKMHYQRQSEQALTQEDEMNQLQIDELLEMISEGEQQAGLIDLEVSYLYDDTQLLWDELSPNMA